MSAVVDCDQPSCVEQSDKTVASAASLQQYETLFITAPLPAIERKGPPRSARTKLCEKFIFILRQATDVGKPWAIFALADSAQVHLLLGY
jgi:hypothetical protein